HYFSSVSRGGDRPQAAHSSGPASIGEDNNSAALEECAGYAIHSGLAMWRWETPSRPLPTKKPYRNRLFGIHVDSLQEKWRKGDDTSKYRFLTDKGRRNRTGCLQSILASSCD